MVNRFCRRRIFKFLYKLFILHKKLFAELLQPGIAHPLYVAQHFAIHLFNIVSAHRQIILRFIFSGLCIPGPLYIDLQRSLEAVHIPIDLHIIHGLKVADPGVVGIPYLCIDGSGLILQRHRLIGLTVFRHRRCFMLAEINVKNFISLFQIFNKFHRRLLSYSSSYSVCQMYRLFLFSYIFTGLLLFL